MPAFIKQVVQMRYTDTEILAQELDQKLGRQNWKCGKISYDHIVLQVRRKLEMHEIAAIEEKMQLHHEGKAYGTHR